MNPPFTMFQESAMERFRFRTWQEKEPETIAWIDSFAPDSTFFDVGANVGIYTLYCAAVHPLSRIFAFEPDAKNHARLLANVLANNFTNLITFPEAVSDHNGLDVFHEASREIGSSGGQLDREPYDCPARYYVTTITLDSFAAMFGTPTHIKIDIDGQELAVVRGMGKTLLHHALRSVLIEVDLQYPRARQEILDAFTAAGFTTDNRFNTMTPHSRTRRAQENILVENVIFTR